MDRSYFKKIEQVEKLFLVLRKMELVNERNEFNKITLPEIPGIYVFYEGKKPLYVGRTNSIKKRIGLHRSTDYRCATFALKLAKEKAKAKNMGIEKFKNNGLLIKDPEFKKIYELMRKRISKMRIKYVEVKDSITQHLLEPYVHIILKTPYNDFDNH